jgi:hypothetical protein
MKVYVDNDERYPDYFMTEHDWGKEIEITDAEWADYVRVCSEYNDWQDKMEKLHNG